MHQNNHEDRMSNFALKLAHFASKAFWMVDKYFSSLAELMASSTRAFRSILTSSNILETLGEISESIALLLSAVISLFLLKLAFRSDLNFSPAWLVSLLETSMT